MLIIIWKIFISYILGPRRSRERIWAVKLRWRSFLHDSKFALFLSPSSFYSRVKKGLLGYYRIAQWSCVARLKVRVLPYGQFLRELLLVCFALSFPKLNFQSCIWVLWRAYLFWNSNHNAFCSLYMLLCPYMNNLMLS